LAAGGFDVILGNPPFLGGLRITGTLGVQYRKYLTGTYERFEARADLCAVFFRRAYAALRRGGALGMIATNSIGQGETRASGLSVIVGGGGTICFARRFVPWGGAASVEVNLIALANDGHARPCLLDGKPVVSISSRLDDEAEATLSHLRQNETHAFQGVVIRGAGFLLGMEESQRLVANDARNMECLLPYLNGDDLNSSPEQQPSRLAICFHDWELERAKRYPGLLRVAEERVKPEREKLDPASHDYRKLRQYWWRFARLGIDMQKAIAPLRRVLVRSEVAEHHMLAFVPKGLIYSHMLIVFAFDDYFHFALLQSNVHEAWVRRNASTMRTDIRYTPTDCFETFPFPQSPPATARAEAERIGEQYHEHRRQLMLARQLGLTKTYNLFHNPECTDADIVRLRDLHAAIDRAILACYGWAELDPGHDFHQNERGQTRYTISHTARRELLRRLLELNLQVASQETSAGGTS
jgi:hypothetical protein